jgi:hypothetical protein
MSSGVVSVQAARFVELRLDRSAVGHHAALR